LFLAFAEGDLGLVRPIVAQLRQRDRLALDYAVPAEPFAAQRSGLIRASLALRIQRCRGAVYLFGAQALADDWACWTLAAARAADLPLVGAPLPGASSGETPDLLAGFGIEVIPLSVDTITQRFAPVDRSSEDRRQNPLAHALHIMRHSLR